MSVEPLNMAVDAAIRDQLAPLGFERARARVWWRRTAEPVSEMVEFQPRKGATYAGVWGWSLSICPLQRGKTMKWKRTAASVELDLMIDPSNDDNAPGFLVDKPFPGYRELDLRQLQRVVKRVTERALDDFRRVRSIHDLDEVCEARARRKYHFLSSDSFVQFKLAWSLAKRARGDDAKADVLLDEWTRDVVRFGARVDFSMIGKANEAARSYAGS
ncbi:MAG: hypothetical protein AB7J28_03490 [Hyphomonadaceae bacterium]